MMQEIKIEKKINLKSKIYIIVGMSNMCQRSKHIVERIVQIMLNSALRTKLLNSLKGLMKSYTLKVHPLE